MHERHHIYKKLYNHELNCHGDDEVKVLLCVKKKFGFSPNAAELLDYKNPPTTITMIACLLSTLVLNGSILFRAIIPLLKLVALTFDLVRDYLLLLRMTPFILAEMYIITARRH